MTRPAGPNRKPVAVGTVVACRDPRAGLRPRFDNATTAPRWRSSRPRPDTCPARWPRLHRLTSDPATHRQRAMVLGLALDNADTPHHWPRPRATHRDHHQRAARHPPRPDHPLRPPHDQRTTPRRDHPRVVRRRPLLHRQPQRQPQCRPKHHAHRARPNPARRAARPTARLRHRHPRDHPTPLPGNPGTITTSNDTITVRLERRAYTLVLRAADLPAQTPIPWLGNRTIRDELT